LLWEFSIRRDASRNIGIARDSAKGFDGAAIPQEPGTK
jgi:hypothetical protein